MAAAGTARRAPVFCQDRARRYFLTSGYIIYEVVVNRYTVPIHEEVEIGCRIRN
jgi:hypothetical protein